MTTSREMNTTYIFFFSILSQFSFPTLIFLTLQVCDLRVYIFLHMHIYSAIN